MIGRTLEIPFAGKFGAWLGERKRVKEKPARVRIREQGDSWIIEFGGESVIAPFPLTNAEPGTDEYQIEAEVQCGRFTESLLNVEVTPDMRSLLRAIAEQCDCLPANPDKLK